MIETVRQTLAAADPALVLGLVGAIAFVTGLGVPGPASLALVLAGAAVAAGAMDFAALMAAGTAGAVAGDLGGHAIGRGGAGAAAGRGPGARRGLAAALARAAAFLQRRGLAAVFLSRWLVSPLGPWVSLAAGAARMPVLPFLAAAVAGRILWVAVYGGVGGPGRGRRGDGGATCHGGGGTGRAGGGRGDDRPAASAAPLALSAAPLPPHIRGMIKFLPILLMVAWAVGMVWFSAWRSRVMLDRASQPLRDPRLQMLTDRLAQAAGVETVQVQVFDMPQVNGLAAPDGRIFLTRGFIEKYRMGFVTAEEMAGVIAHELGHVALGHTRRRMIDVTGQNAVFLALSALLSRFIPIVGIWIAQALTMALAAGLSRRAEHEADAYASALMVKAGLGTAPQKSLFRKLERLTGAAGEGVPDWMRSHPRTEDRIARIEEREARWGLAG